MIPNVKKGGDAGGLMRYLAGPANGHCDQRVICGTIEERGPLTRETRLSIVHDLEATGRAFPDKIPAAGEFWHTSLSLTSAEGSISDAKWAEVARDFMEGMGFSGDSRWIAVHHGPSPKGNDHIHIAASLVTENGVAVSTWRDWPRAQAECARLEVKHGLAVTPGRAAGTGVPGLHAGEISRAKRAGELPERDRLRPIVRRASFLATDETSFMDRLGREGVRGRVVRDGKGLVVAFKGSNVWYPGSSLGHDLTLPKMRAAWATKATGVIPPGGVQKAALGQLRAISTALSAPGVTAAQVAGAAQDVAGALSVAASKPRVGRDVPAAAAACGSMGSYRGPVVRQAIGAVCIALQAVDPDSSVAQAVLIRQLMSTFRAVKEAHLAVGRAGRIGMDETTTVAATVGSRAAQERAERVSWAAARRAERPAAAPTGPVGVLNRIYHRVWRPEAQAELITAADIRASRIADDLAKRPEFIPSVDDPGRVVPVELPIRAEQQRWITAMSKELGVPTNQELLGKMTEQRATELVRTMEHALTPEGIKAAEGHLVAPVPNFTESAVLVDGERLPLPNLGEEPLVSVIPAQVARTESQAEAFEQALLRRADPAVVAAVEAEVATGVAVNRVDAYGMPEEMRAAARAADPTVPGVPDTREGILARGSAAVTPAQQVAGETVATSTRPPLSDERIAELRSVPKPVERWVTGGEPITPRQRYTLRQRGYGLDDLEGMPKAVASQHISGDLKLPDAVAARGTYPEPKRIAAVASKSVADDAVASIAQTLKHERKIG